MQTDIPRVKGRYSTGHSQFVGNQDKVPGVVASDEVLAYESLETRVVVLPP